MQDANSTDWLQVPVVVHLVQSSSRHAASLLSESGAQLWFDRLNQLLETTRLSFEVRRILRTEVDAALLEAFTTTPIKGPGPLQAALVAIDGFDGTALNVYLVRHWPWTGASFGRYRACFVLESNPQPAAGDLARLMHHVGILLGLHITPRDLTERLADGNAASFLSPDEAEQARLGLEGFWPGRSCCRCSPKPPDVSTLRHSVGQLPGRVIAVSPTPTSPEPTAKAIHYFLPLYPSPQQVVPQTTAEGVVAASTGSAPWFDPTVPAQLRLTTYTEQVSSIEVDSEATLATAMQPRYAPAHEVVIYQHWDSPDADGLRAYRVLDETAATRLAERLRGGPTRRLMLVVTSFARGALARLADALESHPLDMMGFFLALAGDDLTEDLVVVSEIGQCAIKLGLKRISILTPLFDRHCESMLMEWAKTCPSLSTIQVFLRDEPRRYPAIPMAGLEAWLAAKPQVD